MEPYAQRMVDEADLLEEKRDALSDFIDNSVLFTKLSQVDQMLMEAQLTAMSTYLGILLIRIQQIKEN